MLIAIQSLYKHLIKYYFRGFDETKSLMSNIHEHLDEIDQQIAAEAETVKDEISEFDPGVMWTPLIISAMVMMGIFVICKYKITKVHLYDS